MDSDSEDYDFWAPFCSGKQQTAPLYAEWKELSEILTEELEKQRKTQEISVLYFNNTDT
jgi:hypothetical protein